MKVSRILSDLAGMMKNCGEQDLTCDRVYDSCSACINKLADEAIARVQRQLDKPEIRSCRIPLQIEFKKMTNLNYWLKSKLFSLPYAERSEPLRQKIERLVDMLQELQLKVLQVYPDYAEQFFWRMATRQKTSTNNLEYLKWRATHPRLTIDRLRQQQVKLTAKVLNAGILEYDERPKGSEIRAVKRKPLKDDLDYDADLTEKFIVECAKLKRYSYWIDKKMFMIDYQEFFVYLYPHCFDDLTMDQLIMLYEYDVQMKMIHEDIMNLEPKLRNCKNQMPRKEPLNEELSMFIHPKIGDEEGRLIQDELKRLVKRNGVQMICEYLPQMAHDNKILLPPNPSIAYDELVRLGMPTGKGFSEKYFRNHYSRK